MRVDTSAREISAMVTDSFHVTLTRVVRVYCRRIARIAAAARS
jgi:antitoxin component of RelBE/YafQ-DinJ toxin-antitoxin module